MDKVIVILPKRLGDTLFCTPAIQFVFKHNPNVEIGVIACSSLCADLLRNNPAIKHLYLAKEVDIGKIRKEYSSVLQIHQDTDVNEWINKLQLPVTVLPAQRQPNEHIADFYLKALGKLMDQAVEDNDKAYYIFPSLNDEKAIDDLFKNNFTKDALLIGLHLGCHSIAKRKWAPWPFCSSLSHEKVWPMKKFVQLAKRLNEYNTKIKFVLTGSNTEKILAQKFTKKISNSMNLVGKTTVSQLKLLCDKLDLYISSDTGPLHVACASQCSVLALVQKKLIYFGTGPFPINGKNHLLAEENLDNLSIDEVYEQVVAILSAII